MSSFFNTTPVPSTLDIVVKTADGQELPARIHWRKPVSLVEMTVFTKENAPGPVVVVSENSGVDAEDLQTAIGELGNPLFGRQPHVVAKRLPVTRLSATLAIDIVVAGEAVELPWPKQIQVEPTGA